MLGGLVLVLYRNSNVLVESCYATPAHRTVTQLSTPALRTACGAETNSLYNLYITPYFPVSTQTNNFAFDYFSKLTESQQETKKCFLLKYFHIKISLL